MKKESTKKIDRCQYVHLDLAATVSGNIRHICYKGDSPANVTETDCEACKAFRSRYIEYPITVTEVKNDTGHDLYIRHVGALCDVRPADGDKTYVGILLGSLPTQIITSHNRVTGVLSNTMMRNPAIFVPELKRVVYGYESWWRRLEPDEISSRITDEAIQNTWYVGLLRDMCELARNAEK